MKTTTQPHLVIEGHSPLTGEIEASGAKNSITKLLIASLLSQKPSIFYGVPEIKEVEITLALCQEIGMKATWDKKAKTLYVHTPELTTTYISQKYSGANRIPILLMGALLGRTSEDIVIPTTAGGCKIGKRPVDYHIMALKALGATIEYRPMKTEGAYLAHAHHGLIGTEIHLPYPSVGATENTLLAACRAKGITTIHNCAIEPEILDLLLYLQKMGMCISRPYDRTIVVEGRSNFSEVEHHVIRDRNEIASFGMAAIATKGRVFIQGATQEPIFPLLHKIQQVGGQFRIKKEGIEFFYDKPLSGTVALETNVHPGFLTDWQQPFVVLLTQTSGMHTVHETVYENRFGYTTTLREMGAFITPLTTCTTNTTCQFHNKNFLHSVLIRGITPLKGQTIHIPDLRGGFAYIMAALIAEGESALYNLFYLERGYEKIEEKLLQLGAKIRLVTPTAQLT